MLGALAKTILTNKMTTANVAIGAISAADTYQASREDGQSVPGAILSAAFDASLATVSMPLYLAYQGITSIAPSAIEGYLDYERASKRDLNARYRQKAFSNVQFNDTEQAYTMRQAGMAIAQRSRYNTQQAMLGNEAKYMMK